MSDNQQDKSIKVPEMANSNRAYNFSELLADNNIPKIYTNGVVLANSLTDVSLILQIGDVPTAVIIMPFATLKGFNNALNEFIPKLEAKMGEEIKDINLIREHWIKEK